MSETSQQYRTAEESGITGFRSIIHHHFVSLTPTTHRFDGRIIFAFPDYMYYAENRKELQQKQQLQHQPTE